jgi:hypothetical protein
VKSPGGTAHPITLTLHAGEAVMLELTQIESGNAPQDE